MKTLLGWIAGLSLVLAGGLAIALFQMPQVRIDLWPAQSFLPVPEDRQPDAPTPWTSSVRPLSDPESWPSLSPLLAAQIEEKGGLAFPVLVPPGFTEDRLSLAASNFRIELLSDGYYAIFRSEHMEIMILGTAVAHHPEGEGPEGQQGDYTHPFQDPGPRPAGGRITFGAYGADYSVTFDCRVTDPGLKRNCISAEGAEALVAALRSGGPTHLKVPAFEGS